VQQRGRINEIIHPAALGEGVLSGTGPVMVLVAVGELGKLTIGVLGCRHFRSVTSATSNSTNNGQDRTRRA
jgi:hypothetical protein